MNIILGSPKYSISRKAVNVFIVSKHRKLLQILRPTFEYKEMFMDFIAHSSLGLCKTII